MAVKSADIVWTSGQQGCVLVSLLLCLSRERGGRQGNSIYTGGIMSEKKQKIILTAEEKKERERETNKKAVSKYAAKFNRINCRFTREDYPAVSAAADIEGKSVGKFVSDAALEKARMIAGKARR